MAVETNARIEFSVASVEEWEKVNPKLHQGEPVFAKKTSGKYILKVGAPGGSTYKNAVVVWDQDDAETKMTSTQEAAAQALAYKNAASASASAAKSSENAAAASKSAAATSAANAKTSETNAAASETVAANSASTASSNATVSANSASAAATSETNAAKSASAAATSEENALSSASAAAMSAGNAKRSETNASSSAIAAKSSENAAAASKIAAATSESNAKTSEANAAASANTAKAWSMSDSSPDKVTGNKSSKTWAEEAKTSASASASSASASASSATNSANSAKAAKQSETASANSAAASASAASAASTSASNAKISETNASNSAKAAKQSEENSKTWDPTQYVKSVTESNGKVTVTKGGGESTTFSAGLNILARNKAYAVGDIAYSPNLPPYLYLECTNTGTTWETEPDMPTLSGAIVDDGTAQFSVKTVCAKEYVDSKSTDEAKKWKNAYNALRKRSTPAVFDDDELTIIMNATHGTGTIQLSRPYTDFDGLLFDIASDTYDRFESAYISTTEINRRRKRAIEIGHPTFFLFSSQYWWAIDGTDASGFSTTVFPLAPAMKDIYGENCIIMRIYGVKFKEIT